MVREILFRGKRIDNGEWVEGFRCKCYTQKAPHTHDAIMYKVEQEDMNASWHNFDYMSAIIDPATVGQYTGLNDKNGQRIFEGDICRFREWRNGDMCWIGKVHYENQQFVISGGPNKECDVPFELQMSRFIPENISVIGNIHDNPELLGGEADA